MKRVTSPPARGRAGRLMTAAALCVSIATAGCTGSLFRSKAVPPAVYLLSAQLTPPATPAATVAAADLAVLRPRLRTGLDTDRIAVLYADRRLDYFANARWSGPLDEVVQDLALQAFESGARLRTVSADGSAFGSGYWLEIQVEDFQAEYGADGNAPSVHVHLTARLGNAGDRKVLGTFDAAARQAASDNRLTAIVEAFERAADSALGELVAATTRTLGEP